MRCVSEVGVAFIGIASSLSVRVRFLFASWMNDDPTIESAGFGRGLNGIMPSVLLVILMAEVLGTSVRGFTIDADSNSVQMLGCE